MFVLTLAIGALSGLAAVSFHQLLEYFQHAIIYAAAAVAGPWKIPLVLAIPALGGLVVGLGIHFLVPQAAGSGIPQVKAAFYLRRGRISWRAIPGKMVLSSLNIGSGASLGREGPTVQICAAISSVLGRFFAISRRRAQSLVPVGAAAGLAAAFNTPIAAVTFTLEEILGNSAAKPLGSIVVASVIAAAIERSILGESALFRVPTYRLNSATELVFYAMLGVVAGVASAAFNKGLLGLRGFSLRQRTVPQWATPAVGGLVVGFLGLAALLITGYAGVFGIGYAQLASALDGKLAIRAMIVLGIGKLAATVVSYGSGSSGGIFGPSLFIGGMIGGVIGIVTQSVTGDIATQPGAFALVGMGAVFAGIVRAPVTSILIIFEMTDSYSIILPLMIANISSYVIASRMEPTPIYDALLRQDGIHMPHTQSHVLREIQAGSAMTTELTTVSAGMTVDAAFRYVQQLPIHHHAYPVIDKAGRFVGLFTFNDLKRALASGQGPQKVGKVANRAIVHAHPDHSLDVVMLKLGRRGISQLPVVSRTDTSKLLGIITMHDVARALSRAAGPEPAPGDAVANS